METIELSIAANYVQDWSEWEALRELYQNGMDAHDMGFPLEINWLEDTPGLWTLTLDNKQAQMDRKSILFGFTTKDGSKNRGHFGEGLKLAWLVLRRCGYTVQCFIQNETWTPTLRFSKIFDINTLHILIEQAEDSEIHFCVKVSGLSTETKDLAESRVLWSQEDKQGLLIDEKYKGKIFSQDLYVHDDTDLQWGYNILLELDRDRKNPPIYNLQSGILHAISHALESDIITDAQFLTAIKCKEGEAIGRFGFYHENLIEAIKNAWNQAYPDPRTVAVCTQVDQDSAKNLGLIPILVNANLFQMLKGAKLTLTDRLADGHISITKYYTSDELTEQERINLANAFNLVHYYLPIKECYVVDFGNNFYGLYDNGKIFLNKVRLSNFMILLGLLIHERSHEYGGEFSNGHIDTMCKLWEALYSDLLPGQGTK